MISRKGIKNKIQCDYGMNNYYSFYKKKYKKEHDFNKIDVKLYTKIINEFNKELFNHIVEKTLDLELPFSLGTIAIRKIKPKLTLGKNGKLINQLPINPIETKKLWDQNEEAKNKKIYIRYSNKHSDGYLFVIKYLKEKAKYKNKKAYFIQPKRNLKRTLSYNIKNKTIDAFEI